MRITLVTETYPPEVNGVALTLERLVTGLAERGHRLEVVRPRQPGDDRGTAGAGGGPATQLLVGGLPIPVYRDLRFGYFNRRRLVARWRAAPPDVVHVATEGPLGLSAVLAARRLRLPVSTSFHTNFHTYGRYYGYGLLTRQALAYLRFVHNRADCTLVPSRDTLETLRGQGFRNLEILGRGVDTRRFDPARRSESLRRVWGAGPADAVVLYVGRLAREKNVALAVEAFRALARRRAGARMVLVGDGPARRELEGLHPDLHFAGQRLGEDLATHYASGDVLLFPSLTETFGNVTTEALASGLAVVAFDYAAAAMHARHLGDAVLVPRGEPASFVRAAVALASDPALVERLRRAARSCAEALSWESVVLAFEDRLHRIAARAA